MPYDPNKAKENINDYWNDNPFGRWAEDQRIKATQDWAAGKQNRLDEVKRQGYQDPDTHVFQTIADAGNELKTDVFEILSPAYKEKHGIWSYLPFTDSYDSDRHKAYDSMMDQTARGSVTPETLQVWNKIKTVK